MSARLVAWRKHSCARNHRTYPAWIRCAIGVRRLLSVQGDDPYAIVSWCGRSDEVTVVMYADLAEAMAERKQLDRMTCGRRCVRLHELVEVVL